MCFAVSRLVGKPHVSFRPEITRRCSRTSCVAAIMSCISQKYFWPNYFAFFLSWDHAYWVSGLEGTHLTLISHPFPRTNIVKPHLTLIRFRAWGVPIARNPHLTTKKSRSRLNYFFRRNGTSSKSQYRRIDEYLSKTRHENAAGGQYILRLVPSGHSPILVYG